MFDEMGEHTVWGGICEQSFTQKLFRSSKPLVLACGISSLWLAIGFKFEDCDSLCNPWNQRYALYSCKASHWGAGYDIIALIMPNPPLMFVAKKLFVSSDIEPGSKYSNTFTKLWRSANLLFHDHVCVLWLWCLASVSPHIYSPVQQDVRDDLFSSKDSFFFKNSYSNTPHVACVADS